VTSKEGSHEGRRGEWGRCMNDGGDPGEDVTDVWGDWVGSHVIGGCARHSSSRRSTKGSEAQMGV
jgi:hypothetical protein